MMIAILSIIFSYFDFQKIFHPPTLTFILHQFAHSSELIVFERLADLSMAVHDKRPSANHRFRNWLTVHHQKLGVGFGSHRNASATAFEYDQISLLDSIFITDTQFAHQHQKRAGVAI